MAISMEVICMAKSQPKKNQKECLNLPQDYMYLAIKQTFLCTADVPQIAAVVPVLFCYVFFFQKLDYNVTWQKLKDTFRGAGKDLIFC